MQRLLAEAQSTRAPMQRLADRVSAIFVPAILLLAACTFIIWAVALNTGGRHAGFAQPFAVTIAVLIIACPCAMGLAVPAAVTVALGRAARAGLLIKGGESLERLARLDTLALDKTGTLTEGRPQIAQFRIAANAEWDDTMIIAAAAAVERSSTHPLAQAVIAFAALQPPHPQPVLNVTDVEVLPGTGIRATVNGREVLIGNATLLPQGRPEPDLTAPAELSYATPLYLLLDGRPNAVFFATDRLRPEAPESVRALQQLGIAPLMLTGDTQHSADAIAREAQISDFRAGLLPAGKLAAIRELQASGHRVGMAGDGINDAASLAQSDAGFAMAAGTDLAREAGDVLLLHSDLRLLPAAVRLGRQTLAIMRQNLGWAFAYNLIGLPIAAGVLYPRFHILLSPVLASAAMALSSVSVLLNSLRLRRARLSAA
jgi:Cu+-exporting ATPase